MTTIPGRRSRHLLCFPILVPALLCFAPLFLDVHRATAANPNGTVLFLINCGSSESSLDSDGRNWTGDVGSNYAPSSRPLNTVGATATVQDPSLPSPVPYMTARISTSPFTYSFPVSRGRKFVRLYFYPSNYSTGTTVTAASDSLFTVMASPGNFTLLRNFSASQTARALTFAYFVREFSVNVSTSYLNLTFTPDASSSYAFVNGIDIVSMPSDFFSLAIPAFVGASTTYTVDQTTALETVYRLNVGESTISPVKDSGGLYRVWSDDSPYIYAAGFGVTPPRAPNVTISYTVQTPEFVAPVDVYGTARSMGPNANINLGYNLTWILPVDSGFYYMVRMHFCEIEYSITTSNQRVFTIYLNNQTAYQDADVIAWSGGNGKAVYKDYVVTFSPAAGQQDLWVALHPYIATKPEYYDAIMNGIEVFKFNQPNGNLAGPNPIPPPPEPKPHPSNVSPKELGKTKSSKVAAIAGGVGGGVTAILLACVFVMLRRRGERRGRDSPVTGYKPFGWSPSPFSGHHNSRTSGSQTSTLPSGLCRHFSLAEIEAATNGFDEALLLGVGGFGKVYRGAIDDGATKVAIKRGNPTSDQGVHEFQTEIEMLSKLRHRHLVSLIGYCEENQEMILVYDYMAQGTLREHLYHKAKTPPPLSWKKRLEICIGAARGLHYLHTGAKHTVIHRDVKTTNILLDEHWVAKVSDFGLSKTGPMLDNSHVSTVVKGSFGYLDPEYYKRQKLTEKSDVYSFGVVLFEVLCARPVLNSQLPKEQVNLADWALLCQRKGALDQIVDPRLKGRIAPQCLKKFAEIAEKCLSDRGIDRPAMGDVLWTLEFALQLQESGAFLGDDAEHPDESLTDSSESPTERATTTTTVMSSTSTSLSLAARSTASVDSDGLTPSSVFSQIMNAQGR